jgi:hypothetical protein
MKFHNRYIIFAGYHEALSHVISFSCYGYKVFISLGCILDLEEKLFFWLVLDMGFDTEVMLRNTELWETSAVFVFILFYSGKQGELHYTVLARFFLVIMS